MEKDEEYKQRAFKELKMAMERPIVSNEECSWVVECLRVVGNHFCMVKKDIDTYEIRMAPQYYAELFAGIQEIILNDKNWQYRIQDPVASYWREFEPAALRCQGIITYLRNKFHDELKIEKDKLEREEGIRVRYRR